MIRSSEHAGAPGRWSDQATGRRRRSLALLALVAAMMACAPWPWAGDGLADDEHVIFFPTAASLDVDAGEWVVPLHAWVFEPEEDSIRRGAAIGALRRALGITVPEDSEIFKQRARAFLVDNERGKTLNVELLGARHAMPESPANGHVHDELRLPHVDPHVQVVLERDTDPWVSVRVDPEETGGRVFTGAVQLVAPTGLSVISDIDDTVKISDVHDRKSLLRNTFVKPFAIVDGMDDVYDDLERSGAVFHYVSSSPWQLYEPLREMLEREGFPPGSMHLKRFRWKDRSFFDLFASSDAIKPAFIESLLRRYPGRRFILFGDSGELDPEIYGGMARAFPEQIAAIAIRIAHPDQALPARFESAFEGLPPDLWCTFDDARELDAFARLAECRRNSDDS